MSANPLREAIVVISVKCDLDNAEGCCASIRAHKYSSRSHCCHRCPYDPRSAEGCCASHRKYKLLSRDHYCHHCERDPGNVECCCDSLRGLKFLSIGHCCHYCQYNRGSAEYYWASLDSKSRLEVRQWGCNRRGWSTVSGKGFRGEGEKIQQKLRWQAIGCGKPAAEQSSKLLVCKWGKDYW